MIETVQRQESRCDLKDPASHRVTSGQHLLTHPAALPRVPQSLTSHSASRSQLRAPPTSPAAAPRRRCSRAAPSTPAHPRRRPPTAATAPSRRPPRRGTPAAACGACRVCDDTLIQQLVSMRFVGTGGLRSVRLSRHWRVCICVAAMHTNLLKSPCNA
jgi:hypothetical protein